MNLRKLLCGLLALCLLLSMAPAALMEEAPVEETIVELGAPEEEVAVEEAVDYSTITPDPDKNPTKLTGNMSVKIALGGEPVELQATGVYCVIDEDSVTVTSGAKYITAEGAGDTLTIQSTDYRPGTGKVKVTVWNEAKTRKTSYVINVTVYDPDEVTKVAFKNEEGKAISSLSIDMTDDADGVTVEAALTPAESTDIVFFKAKGSDIKIEDNGDNTVTIKPVKKGSAKVTATASSGKSATLKVTVTDKHAPTSISIACSSSKKTVAIGDTVELEATVKPLYYGHEENVTWSVDKSSIATLSAKKGEIVELTGEKEGKVKVTAKTPNGKKASITIEVTDPNKVTKILFGEYENKERVQEELYDEVETVDTEKPVKTKLTVSAILMAGDDIVDDVHKYADIKWKSSNKDVATITVPTSKDEADAGVAYVNLKDVGTTKISAEYDGKKVYFTLKVVNSHAVKGIFLEKKSEKCYVGDFVDLADYFEILGNDPWGKVEVVSHHHSIVDEVEGTIVECLRKGNCKVDIKCGGKTATITLKIQE